MPSLLAAVVIAVETKLSAVVAPAESVRSKALTASEVVSSACEVMVMVLPSAVDSTESVVAADCTRLMLLNSAERTIEVI